VLKAINIQGRTK